VQVEVGIDENNDLLKQKLDVYLSCTLVYSSRRNVCRRSVRRQIVVEPALIGLHRSCSQGEVVYMTHISAYQ